MTDEEFRDIHLCAMHTSSYVAHRMEVESRQLTISPVLHDLLTEPDEMRCMELRRCGVPNGLVIYAAALESPELAEREIAMLHEAMARVLL